MGLKEKRATREFQESRFESLKEEIVSNAKYGIELEVEWETLAADNFSHLYDEAWPKVYFKPIIEAFKDMCDDSFTQEALQEGLKKIVICNHNDNHVAGRWAEFKDGVLTLDHLPTTNIDEIDRRKKALIDTVEKEL